MIDTTEENEILLCLEWLDLQDKVATMNTKHTSYSYKHSVERWSNTYISEKSFIEAVHIRGINWKHSAFDNDSILLPLSEKTVRLYRDRSMYERGKRYVKKALTRDVL